jgi:phytanoyl-CoA hydroxylase
MENESASFGKTNRLTMCSWNNEIEIANLTPMRMRAQTLTKEQQAYWENQGFLVIEGLFSRGAMRKARKFLDQLWENERSPHNPLVIDTMLNTQGRRKYFRDATNEERQNVYKLNDAFLEYPAVRDLALDDHLVDVLSALVGGSVCVCNSLHFERGSQQGLHVDTFYMPPPAGGELIAASICLEDVAEDAGPLNYVATSHHIPPFLNSDGGRNIRSSEEQGQANWYYQAAIRDRGLREQKFLGRAGDVIIWHEQLVHGGLPIQNMKKTRKSLVVHYWRCAEMDQSVLRSHGRGFYMARSHATVG